MPEADSQIIANQLLLAKRVEVLEQSHSNSKSFIAGAVMVVSLLGTALFAVIAILEKNVVEKIL